MVWFCPRTRYQFSVHEKYQFCDSANKRKFLIRSRIPDAHKPIGSLSVGPVALSRAGAQGMFAVGAPRQTLVTLDITDVPHFANTNDTQPLSFRGPGALDMKRPSCTPLRGPPRGYPEGFPEELGGRPGVQESRGSCTVRPGQANACRLRSNCTYVKHVEGINKLLEAQMY